MKISELKAMLSLYPDDMEVHIAYNYNGLLVAPKMEYVTEALVEYSKQYKMDVLLDIGNPGGGEVLVLMPLL